MNTQIISLDLSGERTGRKSPIAKFITALALVLATVSPVVASAETKYLKDNAESFLTKIESSYGQMIDIAALLHDYDAKLITAVIVVESEGNTTALSNKGARGLMQLMPGTAKAMGASDPKDPFQNILAGTKYLKELEQRYGFGVEESLVAYNMGPSRAKRWLSQYDANEYGYVQKVMYVYGVLAEMEEEGAKTAKNDSTRIAQGGLEGARPMMTKPKSIALAGLPLSLPSLRRADIETED